MGDRIFFDRDLNIIIGACVSANVAGYLEGWYYNSVHIEEEGASKESPEERVHGNFDEGYVFQEGTSLPNALPIRQHIQCHWEKDFAPPINTPQPRLGPQYGPRESTPMREARPREALKCGEERRFSKEEELLWAIRQLERGVPTGKTVFCDGGITLTPREDRTYIACHGNWVDDVMIPGGTMAALPGRVIGVPAYFDITGDGIKDLVIDLEILGETGIRAYFRGVKT